MKFAIDQNLEVIFLDFDGTLVPSEEIFFSAYQKNVFNEFGLDIKFADYKQHELHSDAKLFSVLKEKTNVAITEDQFMNKVYQDYGLAIEKLFFNEDIIINLQLIEKLKNQGIRFGIVSSSKIEFIKKILQHFQATDLFEIIISRENVKNKKPHSEPYELATNFIQVDKNKILVIEDTIKGALSAKSAGLKVVISKEYSHLSEKEITQSGFVACVGLKQIFMLLLNK